MLSPQSTLNLRGHLLDLTTPQVMGILNLTPDSFFPGSRMQGTDALLEKAEQMLSEGASILDLGGMSSRPGAEMISEEEELRRVVPAIEALVRRFPDALLSVDTVRSRVARESVQAGAAMINDISAGRLDPAMYETVASLRVPYVLMHMKGMPDTMQKDPVYEDVLIEVMDFLIAELGKLRDLGIHDVILDPGFGFGKTVAHNYELLKNLSTFQILERPLLVGISRKSMITRVLGVSPAEALNGTTALHMVALQEGAKILRVHDVKEAVEVV
ncbi:MAG: dihydropteroate synthase, partial [Saprospirales bacterium]|nr:dihydropteroate synthase [Saprospirales bacterium]